MSFKEGLFLGSKVKILLIIFIAAELILQDVGKEKSAFLILL